MSSVQNSAATIMGQLIVLADNSRKRIAPLNTR